MPGINHQLKVLLAKCNYRFNYLKLLSFFTDNFKILTYHRIIDQNTNPYQIEDGMFVLPETFAMHLELLKKKYQVLASEELIFRLENNKEIFKNTIVISIDDGWYDNYQFAYPIIKSADIPVSIFLATAFIGTNKLFWTDYLIYLLTLHTNNKIILENNLNCQETFKLIIQSNKINNYAKLINSLKLKSEIEIENMLTCLSRNLADNKIDTTIKFRTFMTWEEIDEMKQNKNISFYNHSHSHKNFSKLTYQDILSELKLSFDTLKNKGIECSSIFCYPGGAYNELSQKALMDFEINYSLITEGKNQLKNNPKILKRINIHDDITNTKELFKFRIEF